MADRSVTAGIRATRHVANYHGEFAVSQVVIGAPPVACADMVDVIFGSWWLRAGGYPVGRHFGMAAEDQQVQRFSCGGGNT